MSRLKRTAANHVGESSGGDLMSMFSVLRSLFGVFGRLLLPLVFLYANSENVTLFWPITVAYQLSLSGESITCFGGNEGCVLFCCIDLSNVLFRYCRN